MPHLTNKIREAKIQTTSSLNLLEFLGSSGAATFMQCSWDCELGQHFWGPKSITFRLFLNVYAL